VIRIDDAYRGGEHSDGKRGRRAPGETPFVAAVETTAEGKLVRQKLRQVTSFCATSIAGFAKRSLIQTAPSSATAFSASPALPTPAARTRSSNRVRTKGGSDPTSNGSTPRWATSRPPSQGHTVPSKHISAKFDAGDAVFTLGQVIDRAKP